MLLRACWRKDFDRQRTFSAIVEEVPRATFSSGFLVGGLSAEAGMFPLLAWQRFLLRRSPPASSATLARTCRILARLGPLLPARRSALQEPAGQEPTSQSPGRPVGQWIVPMPARPDFRWCPYSRCWGLRFPDCLPRDRFHCRITDLHALVSIILLENWLQMSWLPWSAVDLQILGRQGRKNWQPMEERSWLRFMAT